MEIGFVKQALNNEIIKLKHSFKQAKVQIINKLLRKSKALKVKSSQKDDIKDKMLSKAEQLLNEVFIMKKLKARDVAEFLLKNDKNVQQFLNSPIATKEKAMSRLITHKSLFDNAYHIKDKFLNMPVDLLLAPGKRQLLKQEKSQSATVKKINKVSSSKKGVSSSKYLKPSWIITENSVDSVTQSSEIQKQQPDSKVEKTSIESAVSKIKEEMVPKQRRKVLEKKLKKKISKFKESKPVLTEVPNYQISNIGTEIIKRDSENNKFGIDIRKDVSKVENTSIESALKKIKKGSVTKQRRKVLEKKLKEKISIKRESKPKPAEESNYQILNSSNEIIKKGFENNKIDIDIRKDNGRKLVNTSNISKEDRNSKIKNVSMVTNVESAVKEIKKDTVTKRTKKILEKKFKKVIPIIEESKPVPAGVDAFFVTDSGDNYETLVDKRVEEPLSQSTIIKGNRQMRRAAMFGRPQPYPSSNKKSIDNGKPFKKPEKLVPGKFLNKSVKLKKEISQRPQEDISSLHPSWQAKKKQSNILEFKGKKVMFDD